MSAAVKIGAIGITPEELKMAAEIADAIQRKLPRSVLRDDLQQAALIGLWDAVRRDTGDRTPEQRRGYLITRIRGQILDELRAQDWAKRRHKKRKNGGAPLEPVVVVRFDDVGHREAGHSFEECLACPRPNPEEQTITRIDQGRAVSEALGAPLSERHLHIVRGHYMRGTPFHELGTQLGVSEPRVSQLHSQAINAMHGWLTGGEQEHPPEKRASLVARKAIAAKWENHEHRRADRRAGEHPHEDPPSRIVRRSVPGGGLGGPPAATSHRPVPGGAGGAELGRETRPGLPAAPGSGPRGGAVAGAAPAPSPGVRRGGRPQRGGVALMAALPVEPVPSVLPEEGLDLRAELERYKDWLIQQALVRTLGNVHAAAKLVRVSAETIYARTRDGRLGRKSEPPPVEVPARASAREESPPMIHPPVVDPSSPEALAQASLARVAARIPWDRVAVLRAEGKSEGQIAKIMKGVIGAHQWTIEKALRLPRPLAKCGP
jgi:RNA polymerase sigma factor for flagellar operon FliA